jgi:hypothetical protein
MQILWIEENKINANLRSRGKEPIVLVYKDKLRLFIEYQQLRKKLFHSPELDLTLDVSDETLKEIIRLGDPKMFEERRTLFFNKKLILDAVIKKYGEDLRRLILDSNTKLKKGTFGKN